MQGRTVLGKYKIGRLIGRGSMGQVYLAQPKDGGPDVVVKFMNEQVAAQPRFRELFAQEIEVMGRFHHPNAVRLLGGNIEEAVGPCIVMEYVGGVDLGELISVHGRLDADRLGGLLLPLCQGLHAAHTAGIIHRDLKPANIKVVHPGEPNETIKIMDLGLAALAYKPYIPLDKLKGSTDEHLVGSPAYMCPEQVRGDNSDARADIYSLGILMFETLTGRLPFEDNEIIALLKAHVHQTPPRFADLGIHDVPHKVEAVVRLCLEKFPNERPATPMALAQSYAQAMGFDVELDEADFLPQQLTTNGSPGGSGGPPTSSNTERIVQTMTAWMPEAVALIKLRGFMEDLGANLIDSSPGLIRVQLGTSNKRDSGSGLMSWFRKAPSEGAPLAPVAIDLHMIKKAGPGNRLDITLVFRSLNGPLPADERWHQRTSKLFNDLRSYLMAQS
jgi:eukaryotic-like serine/threonine-protein kinase